MRSLDNFAAFILTHGRPDKVVTYRTLRRAGYTGRIILLVDDEDPDRQEYEQRYGDEVVVFSKAEAAEYTDVGDNDPKRNVVVFARNACFRVAADLGIESFVQLDDDYTNFSYRWRIPGATEDWELRQMRSTRITNMDDTMRAMLDLLYKTDALTVAFAQAGEMIGGVASHVARLGWKRKAMNSFFCRTDRPVEFMGRINEDTTSYCLLGQVGALFMTISQVSLSQSQTQQQTGGLTDAYLDYGTYTKSFYTVMMCPSFVTVRSLGQSERRMHHHIDWDHGVPKILAPELRKVANG